MRGTAVPAAVSELFGIDAEVGGSTVGRGKSFVVDDSEEGSGGDLATAAATAVSAVAAERPRAAAAPPPTAVPPAETRKGKAKEKTQKEKKPSFFKRVRKSVKRASKKVGGKLRRLGGRSLPSELALRAADKFRSESSRDGKILRLITMQKVVRAPRHPKDKLDKIRAGLIAIWRAVLDELTNGVHAKIFPAEHSRYHSLYYDIALCAMERTELLLLPTDTERESTETGGRAQAGMNNFADGPGRLVADLMVKTFGLCKSIIDEWMIIKCLIRNEYDEARAHFCARVLANGWYEPHPVRPCPEASTSKHLLH